MLYPIPLCFILIGHAVGAPGRSRSQVHPESRSEHYAAPLMNVNQIQAHITEATTHFEQETSSEALQEVHFMTPRLRHLADNARALRARHPSTQASSSNLEVSEVSTLASSMVNIRLQDQSSEETPILITNRRRRGS